MLKNHKQKWPRNSCMDLISEEMCPLNSPSLNPWDKCHRVYKGNCPKLRSGKSANSTKLCRWQDNSGCDRQSWTSFHWDCRPEANGGHF